MDSIGIPIKFHKDDPKFANDLSFMTDEDWAKVKKSRRIKELRDIVRAKRAKLNRESLFTTLFDEILTEAKTLKRSGPKTLDSGDLSNFLFANSNGGTEIFTVYATREVDSKTDPSKKAGDPMIIQGTLWLAKKPIKKDPKYRNPSQDTRRAYENYGAIKMIATSVDGKDYRKKPLDQRMRQPLAKNIKKIVIGGETYNVT